MCSASCPAVFCCVGIVLRCAVCGLFASVGECGVGAGVLSFAFFWLCSVVRCGLLCECLAFGVVPCCGRGVVCCAVTGVGALLFLLLTFCLPVLDHRLRCRSLALRLSASSRGVPSSGGRPLRVLCCVALRCGVLRVVLCRVVLCSAQSSF